jgi:hypothetical protein
MVIDDLLCPGGAMSCSQGCKALETDCTPILSPDRGDIALR